ncbi:hypothetical protein ACFSHP_19765 [Novosphingobium panipatense]
MLIEPPSPNVLGFYTLSNTSLQAADLPAALVKKLPRYPVLPATLLGRLAVNAKGRGRGWERSFVQCSPALPARRDGLDGGCGGRQGRCGRFLYERHDFVRLPEQPNRLFMPMAEIEKLFASAGDRRP